MRNKKIVFIIGGVIVVVIAFIIVFSFIFSTKKLVCQSTSSRNMNDYVVETKYEIEYRKDIVRNVHITEVITSEDEDLINTLYLQFNQQFKFNKKTYGGYSYSIDKSNNKIVSKVNINYILFDMDQFQKNNVAVKKYLKNNRLTLDGAKEMYAINGAKCE